MEVSSKFIWNPVYKKFTGKSIFMPFPLLHLIKLEVNSYYHSMDKLLALI